MVAAAIEFAKHEKPARTRATLRGVAIVAVIAVIGFSVAALSCPPESLSHGLWFGVGANVFIVALVVACSNAWAYATSRVDVIRVTDHGVHWNGTVFTWDSVTQVWFSELPDADNIVVFFMISRPLPRSRMSASILITRRQASDLQAALTRFFSDFGYNVTLRATDQITKR